MTVTQKDLSKEYRSEPLGKGVWRIRDFGGSVGNEDMYLFEGKDRALLLDTGMGRGDLAGYVRSLTSLPVDVAITHGNRDHFLQVDQERTPLTGRAGKQLITDMRTAVEKVLRGELEGNPARTVRDGSRIRGVQRTVSCPGRQRTNTGREGAPGTYVDADPINIRLSLLMVDRIALAAVTGGSTR